MLDLLVSRHWWLAEVVLESWLTGWPVSGLNGWLDGRMG